MLYPGFGLHLPVGERANGATLFQARHGGEGLISGDSRDKPDPLLEIRFRLTRARLQNFRVWRPMKR